MIGYPQRLTPTSLEEFGMTDVLLLWPDGTYSGLGGLLWMPDTTLVMSLFLQAPKEARLYANKASMLVNIEMRLH